MEQGIRGLTAGKGDIRMSTEKRDVAGAEPVGQGIVDYIEATAWATLATVREDGSPALRTMGNFATGAGGRHIYFSTGKEADKSRHIRSNPRVSFLFQHEGQELAAFRNVAAVGNAELLTGGPDLSIGAETLSARCPHFRAQVDRDGLDSTGVYRVRVEEIKELDFRRGFGPEAVVTVRVFPADERREP
jgi:hypothetical protein